MLLKSKAQILEEVFLNEMTDEEDLEKSIEQCEDEIENARTGIRKSQESMADARREGNKDRLETLERNIRINNRIIERNRNYIIEYKKELRELREKKKLNKED